MLSRTDNSVSVWWDGQCVIVTLPTTTFYLTMQEARLFGEEVSNKLLSVGQHGHIAVAGGVLSPASPRSGQTTDRFRHGLAFLANTTTVTSNGDSNFCNSSSMISLARS